MARDVIVLVLLLFITVGLIYVSYLCHLSLQAKKSKNSKKYRWQLTEDEIDEI